MYLFVSLLTSIVAIACLAVADDANPTVTIANGPIIGKTTSIPGPSGSIAVNQFLGIPYAAAPTGSARFTPPRPPANWASRNAQDYGASCIQVFAPVELRNLTEAVFNNPRPASESEDCLFINVFAPRKASNITGTPYPVMYWIYGGGWKFGNAAQPWYHGSHFAGLEDVVVVSVNYRLNVFGLPVNPTITNVTERNLALLDQRLGLQWVQDNIHNFGGNKSQVTIFGESAGAYATDILISSYAPGIPRPFRAGIMESGVSAYLPVKNCDNNNFDAWNNLTASLNCKGDDKAKFDCVKNASATDLKNKQEANLNITFAHGCDDGLTMVSDPRTRLEAGKAADVPVLLGSNTADGSVYTAPIKTMDKFFDAFFDSNRTLQRVALAEYKLGTEGMTDIYFQMERIYTDYFFHCPPVWYAETSTKFRPTYRYLFNATFKNTAAPVPIWPTTYQKAYHSSEIPIVFSSYDASTAEAGQNDLSNKMRAAWASFARDPSKAPSSDWPRVGQGQGKKDVMSFGSDGKGKTEVVEDDVHHCAFWAKEGWREKHA